jgi:hypothetical protein
MLTLSLNQHQAVVIGIIRVILHHLDGITVSPNGGEHVDSTSLHRGARFLVMDASLAITLLAQSTWRASKAKGLVKAGKEYAAFQVADDSGGASDNLAVDQECMLVTGYHLTRFQVGGRMRRAGEACVIAVAAIPTFNPNPGRGDNAGSFDQFGFQRPQFLGLVYGGRGQSSTLYFLLVLVLLVDLHLGGLPCHDRSD